jgi:hypothetical protein
MVGSPSINFLLSEVEFKVPENVGVRARRHRSATRHWRLLDSTGFVSEGRFP